MLLELCLLGLKSDDLRYFRTGCFVVCDLKPSIQDECRQPQDFGVQEGLIDKIFATHVAS